MCWHTITSQIDISFIIGCYGISRMASIDFTLEGCFTCRKVKLYEVETKQVSNSFEVWISRTD